MIIKPSIRSNVFTNAHPGGSKAYVENLFREAGSKEPFEGPKNVLIIGGSSGYGLASRVALSVGAEANTINVSFERPPSGKKTGTAGWWNNIWFQERAKKEGTIHKDFVMDAFSEATKETVAKTIKDTLGTVDLVIYSLAAGARPDPKTGELVHSHIKTIGEVSHGKTIDVAKEKVVPLTVEPADEKEIRDTVFVMGGSDWERWIETLMDHDVLDYDAKTIAYTYIGGPTTSSIYRDGTLGKAKEDLEKTAYRLNDKLERNLGGEALISSSKAVVTKASVFIPQMPIYVSCLFDVMMNHEVHETILEHKYRLYQDMVYGTDRAVDTKGRLRMDRSELDDTIQEETKEMMDALNDDDLLKTNGANKFFDTFYKIHGFRHEGVDYEADVDMEELSKKKPE
ncbi:MAG: enoyl-ACP reductase FabV [Candidatus Izemoplasmataceae bacterium]